MTTTKKMSCYQLACLIKIVSGAELFSSDHGAALDALEEDPAALEWLCRLIPAAVLQALEKHGDTPTWGWGHAVPADIMAQATFSPDELHHLEAAVQHDINTGPAATPSATRILLAKVKSLAAAGSSS